MTFQWYLPPPKKEEKKREVKRLLLPLLMGEVCLEVLEACWPRRWERKPQEAPGGAVSLTLLKSRCNNFFFFLFFLFFFFFFFFFFFCFFFFCFYIFFSFCNTHFSKTKPQSETLIKVCKEDLKEFTKTISDDTSTVVKELGSKATQNISQQVASLKAVSTNISASSSSSSSTSAQQQLSAQSTLALNAFEARLLALQADQSTYLEDPNDEEAFARWKEAFDLQNKNPEICELLSNNPTVREIYKTLVPEKVSYPVFWQRYLFTIEQLHNENQQRILLLQRAEEQQDRTLDVGWGWDGDEEVEEEPVQEQKDKQVQEPQPTTQQDEKNDEESTSKQQTEEADVDEEKEIEEEIIKRTQGTHLDDDVANNTDVADLVVEEDQSSESNAAAAQTVDVAAEEGEEDWDTWE
ncbi:ARM repeat-containing protein, variant 2 [Balamuthia mandrillaris]